LKAWWRQEQTELGGTGTRLALGTCPKSAQSKRPSDAASCLQQATTVSTLPQAQLPPDEIDPDQLTEIEQWGGEVASQPWSGCSRVSVLLGYSHR